MTWTYKQSTGEIFHNGSKVDTLAFSPIKIILTVSRSEIWDHFPAGHTP